jgi:hypothetical protein
MTVAVISSWTVAADTEPPSLAITIAIIGAVATFGVGVLNYVMQRRSLTQERRALFEQLTLNYSAQLAEQLSKAFAQLESNNTAVRVGGVYALERVAQQSPTDRANIAVTLAAFVRQLQRAPDPKYRSYVAMLKVRAPDAQAAMDVLSRPPLSEERTSREAGWLDLSRTDLRRASLKGADLRKVNLWLSRLDGADLRNAQLQESILSDADVGIFEPNHPYYTDGADLRGANLTGAKQENMRGLEHAILTDIQGFLPET